MLDKFRDLSDTAKMIVIGAILVVFVAIIVFVSSFVAEDSKPVIENENPNLPYPTQSIEPGPSPSATASTPPAASESAEPTAEPTVEPTEEPIPYGETTLNLEDQTAAQSIAKAGILEYYSFSKNQDIKVKESNLKKYFSSDSGVFTTESLQDIYGLETIDDKNYLISMATIDYIDPVGGTVEEYKVIVGLTYKTQFNREGSDPQILERNDTYSMILSKASGEWRIVSMEN